MTSANNKKKEAIQLVKWHSLICSGATLIPIPIVDSISVTAIQLNLLSELSELYEQEFSENLAKSFLASLSGGLLTAFFSQSTIACVFKSFVIDIPLIGYPLRYTTGPAFIGGYTYLLGKAFILHYESGGQFFDFNLQKFKEYVSQILSEEAIL